MEDGVLLAKPPPTSALAPTFRPTKMFDAELFQLSTSERFVELDVSFEVVAVDVFDDDAGVEIIDWREIVDVFVDEISLELVDVSVVDETLKSAISCLLICSKRSM